MPHEVSETGDARFRVVIPRSELPIPVSDSINKFRYRVVNENRNIYSDWSVVNYVQQVELDKNSTRGTPPTGPANPGDILNVISVDPVDNWDIGWTPVGTWVEDNNIVTTDMNYDMPPGGLTNEVLTKYGDGDYEADWEPSYGVPDGGAANTFLKKRTGADGDYVWDTGMADPQDGNFIIGIAVLS